MTDGCGVVAFALPLRVIATMYARLAERLPRQFAAMTAHPELVRGDGDLDTEAMRAIPGCVSKGGAEALSCIGLPREGIGVAVRIDDGNAAGERARRPGRARAAAVVGRAARRPESVVRAGAGKHGGRPRRTPAGPGGARLTL